MMVKSLALLPHKEVLGLNLLQVHWGLSVESISSSCTCVGSLVVNQLSPAVHRYCY